MMITEFLETRIAEDEADAINRVVLPSEDRRSLTLDDAEKVHREIAAKRAISEMHERHRENRDARRSPRAREAEDAQAAQDRRTQEARTRVAEDALRALAAVYADHPDYQQEWTP